MGEVIHCFQWLLQYGLYSDILREWFGCCFIFVFNFGVFFDSSSATEHPWLEGSPKASPSLQLSMGNSRPLGGYIVPSEFSNAVQDVSLLSHFQTPGLQVVTLSSLENSPAEPQQEPAVSSSARAYLSYGGGNRGSSSPREETQATFIANTSISPKTVSSSVANAEDNSFLTQNFLTVASAHNSQNSAVQQHHGGNLHAQPPLPEKKRSSEGDRSFASVSPSSSGFSSPHSGSTISIPFPNVLPDFSKMLSTSPVPGRFCIRETQNILDFIWVYKKHLGDFKSGEGKKKTSWMKMAQRTWIFAVSGSSSLALVLFREQGCRILSALLFCFRWPRAACLLNCQTTSEWFGVQLLFIRAGFSLHLSRLVSRIVKNVDV